MKQAFEKILERLNKEKEKWLLRGTEFSAACGTTIIDEVAFGTSNGLCIAKEIVQEVAEECKNELGVSERIKRIVPPSIPDDNKRSYCMICGENVNENYNYCKKCGVQLKECDNVWMI